MKKERIKPYIRNCKKCDNYYKTWKKQPGMAAPSGRD